MPILQSIGAAIIGLFIVAALIAFNPMIAVLTFAGFGAIYVAVSLFVRKRLSSNARTIAKIQMEAIRAVQEGLGGIRDVLIDGTQPAFLARFSELNRHLWKAQRTNSLAAVTPRFAIEAAGMVLIAGLACLLVTRTSNVTYVLPILGVFALGAQRLLPLMQLFYGNWALIVGNLAGARVVLTLLEAPVGDDRPGTSVEPLPFPQSDRLQGRHIPLWSRPAAGAEAFRPDHCQGLAGSRLSARQARARARRSTS